MSFGHACTMRLVICSGIQLVCVDETDPLPLQVCGGAVSSLPEESLEIPEDGCEQAV